MEEILSEAKKALSTFLGLPEDRKDEVAFKCCRSTENGDIYCPKGAQVEERMQAGTKLEDILMLQSTINSFFSNASFNPQGHLCLTLNRPLVFTKTIHDVNKLGESYGISSSPYDESESPRQILLVNHNHLEQSTPTPSSDEHTASARGETQSMHTDDLSLPDGRKLLAIGFLANLLRAAGHPVSCANHHISTKKALTEDDPGYQVWHLLAPFFGDGSHSCEDIMTQQFLASLQHSRVSFGSGDCASVRNMVVDVRTFLTSNGLIGKGGYEKNLDKIQGLHFLFFLSPLIEVPSSLASDGSGHLTPVSSMACDICKLHMPSRSGHMTMMIHVAQQQKSYSVQQSMALAEMYRKANSCQCMQHLLLTSGVECFTCGKPTKQCSLNDLLRVRTQQMTEAYVIKYGDRARGPQLQGIATQMAEAVVKFDLLSTDLSSTVKLDRPDPNVDQAAIDPDVRSPGAFVLYNYARLATLFTHFKKACERGVYSPLPDVTKVDFTLLKEEEEWQLLFHYVLQYPMVVREAAQLRGKGVGVHLDISLKKICLFLVQLSHSFSSYYSRIKILLPAEPHLLPLVYARLSLASAVKQVMYNGLKLLAIEPLEQL